MPQAYEAKAPPALSSVAAALHLDQIEPLAIRALAFILAPCVAIGALDHVGAGGGRGEASGLEACTFEILVAPRQRPSDALLVDFGKQRR